MHFAVTGGAGFVGSHLVKLLVEEGHEITVIDNLHKGKKENLASVINKIKFQKMDIQDYESMRKILKNVDGVFHQAALTVVQDSFARPEEYFDVNVHGTENIFKLANENKFKVVYASSSSVYGHKLETPITENAEVTEKFTRTSADEILYEFSVNDDVAYKDVWRGEMPLRRAEGNIYEYACHEGNYSMANILAGAREEERRNQ